LCEEPEEPDDTDESDEFDVSTTTEYDDFFICFINEYNFSHKDRSKHGDVDLIDMVWDVLKFISSSRGYEELDLDVTVSALKKYIISHSLNFVDNSTYESGCPVEIESPDVIQAVNPAVQKTTVCVDDWTSIL
jgi:hypothetical protein